MTVKNAETIANKPFVISRVFDAPRDLVWKVWTDAEHLANWFGPKGTTVPFSKMDFRISGTYHYCQRMPNGGEMWGKMTYLEIKAPEKIVVIQCFSDENAGVTRHPMAPTWPLETLATTTLSESHGKTTLTIQWEPYHANEVEQKTFDGAHDGMNQGWGGTLEQLEKYLVELTGKEYVEYPSDKEMVFTRFFDSPRDLVWKAFTDPKIVVNWWGPKGFTNTIHEMEVKPGGHWRLTMRGPDGKEYPNRISYIEVEKPSRMVYDHGDDANPKMFYVTIDFTEVGGKTKIVWSILFPTAEACAETKKFAVAGHSSTTDRLEAKLFELQEKEK